MRSWSTFIDLHHLNLSCFITLISSRVIPIIRVEERSCNETQNERLNGLDPKRLITNDLSDRPKSYEVIFINKLKLQVRMLIYYFQMGGKTEGNKKMINVPIEIEINDNNLVSESSHKKEYPLPSPTKKVIEF